MQGKILSSHLDTKKEKLKLGMESKIKNLKEDAAVEILSC